ncbi:MAG: ribonuclease H-like domain-containing protein [Planctomycetes bacterium]|nr:ribonuclease H-like domain-containing protein [Planctomycetota bacterium]
MDLRAKLQRGFGVAPAPAAAPAPDAALRAMLQRHAQREVTRHEPVALPEGREARNARGAFFLRTLRYPLATRHGHHALGDVLGVDHARLARHAREPRCPAVLPQECLFLDTETTGLGGGSGTLVFLCGIGRFDAGAFELEQVFLRSFAEEAAALAHVAQRVQESPWLVSFVGKTFDRHRLHARMTVHRVTAPILGERHFDLYYAARRAFGTQLPDCRLRTLEAQVLGVVRCDDLPGAEAPAAFLDWVRDGSGAVDRVFEHNRLDVLTLVSLMARLGAVEPPPPRTTCVQRPARIGRSRSRTAPEEQV